MRQFAGFGSAEDTTSAFVIFFHRDRQGFPWRSICQRCEAWALPTEFAATLALRTQQVIAHESGVTNTVDPLGRLVLRRNADQRGRARCLDYIEKIDAMGGMVRAIGEVVSAAKIADASTAIKWRSTVKRKSLSA